MIVEHIIQKEIDFWFGSDAKFGGVCPFIESAGECVSGCGVLQNCNRCIDDYNDKQKRNKKWHAYITNNRKRTNLGYYWTEIEALQARIQGMRLYRDPITVQAYLDYYGIGE